MSHTVRVFKPTEKHLAVMKDFKDVLVKHGDALTAMDLLAVAAQLVGSILALQDNRVYTSKDCLEIVSQNIEIGNKATINTYLGKTVGNA